MFCALVFRGRFLACRSAVGRSGWRQRVGRKGGEVSPRSYAKYRPLCLARPATSERGAAESISPSASTWPQEFVFAFAVRTS